MHGLSCKPVLESPWVSTAQNDSASILFYFSVPQVFIKHLSEQSAST